MFYFTKKEIANIILHIIFIATFLTIFFFTYTASVEKQMVKNQVGLILKNLFNNAKYIDDNIKLEIGSKINTLEPPDLSQEDKETKKNNEEIFNNAIKMIVIGSTISLIISYYLFKLDSDPNKGSFYNLLKENVVLLMSVAFTEFMFLNLISKNYVYGDANFIKKQILITLKKESEKM